MGYLNSPIVVACLQTLSPTLDYHEGPMGKVPYEDIENVAEIDVFVKSNLTISKLDWDSHRNFLGLSTERAYFPYRFHRTRHYNRVTDYLV